MNTRTAILAAAALILTGLGAAGWAMWNSTSAAHGGRALGYGVTVEVVPPVEPDLPPGSILTVGELRDGYEHDPERLAPLNDPDESAIDSAWVELMPALADEAVALPVPPVVTMAASPRPELRQDDYGFGFDAPRPDYQAERQARISALDGRSPDSTDESPIQ